MDLELKGRVCVITGASAGIGVGVAQVLAAEGTQVVLVARRKELLEKTAAEATKAAGASGTGGNLRPMIIAADITASETPGRIAKEVLDAFGRIDVLVNNAGGSRPIPVDAGDDVWNEGIALNFTAHRRMAQAVIPTMMARKWGRIINVSGTKELRSVNAAAAAKGALEIWTKGLAGDLAAHGITANIVAPGRIVSEQILNKLMPTEEIRRDYIKANIPMGYLGEPKDMANLIAFLASPLARYITGVAIRVDGGMGRSMH